MRVNLASHGPGIPRKGVRYAWNKARTTIATIANDIRMREVDIVDCVAQDQYAVVIVAYAVSREV